MAWGQPRSRQDPNLSGRIFLRHRLDGLGRCGGGDAIGFWCTGATRFREVSAVRGGCGTEKFGDVANVGETKGTQLVLDGDECGVQFERGRGIEFVDGVGGLADDVVVWCIIETQRVKGGAVVEVGAPHDADLLEHGHAAINGDEVATTLTQRFVDGFDALGLAEAEHRGQDRQPGLRNPQVGGFEPRGRRRHRGFGIVFG